MSILLDLILAFLAGGALCVIAQILIDRTNLAPARILVCYVVAGVILGAVGIYPALLELAGAGAATPLCGFGNLIAEGVRKAVDEKGIEIKTAIIVCKAFHARRCLMLYQMAFPNTDIKVCPVHCYNITKENWYQTEYGTDRVLGELARCGNQFVGDIKNYLFNAKESL